MLSVIAAILLTNAADVASAFLDSKTNLQFQVEGIVRFPFGKGDFLLAVQDESGAIAVRKDLRKLCPDKVKAGDSVMISGVLKSNSIHGTVADCKRLKVLARGEAPQPILADPRMIKGGKCDFLPVRIRGTVRETFWDEIDPTFFYFEVNTGDDTVYATLPVRTNRPAVLESLTDAEVLIDGLCYPACNDSRRFIGRTILLSCPESIQILHPAGSDPFAVPSVADLRNRDAHEIALLGRRRANGHVVAVWQGNRALIKTSDGELVKAELDGTSMPAIGDSIEVVGLPTTDLYNVHLIAALWRPSECERFAAGNATDMTIEELMTDGKGRVRINTQLLGKTIRLKGSVLDLPTTGTGLRTCALKCGDFIIPVDIGASPAALANVSIGCEVRVTGVCIAETSNWHRLSQFPHIGGFTIVIRSPEDIVILARPPWWTSKLSRYIIGSIVIILLGIIIWNRILKSRKLLPEQIAYAYEKLKVEERTRLAVELHDSLSQTLTGVSFQIDAAEQARLKDPSQIKRYLDTARQTLHSCREELKNCLWDLRNNALEESDSEVAIRRTVEPHIGETEMELDFKVPRKKLTDNTFHSILCVIRELATNAVLHGKAKHISIRGNLDADNITLSVSDDGCGFDPEDHPGADEGHFGLLGVSERIETLNGSMKIISTIGSGTSINITIKI